MHPSELFEIIKLYNKMDYDEKLCNKNYNQSNLNNGWNFEDVHNSELTAVDYIKFLQENLNSIKTLEECNNFKTRSETTKHIELSIKYLDAINVHDYKTSDELTTFTLSHNMPLYEFILSFYKIIKYYKKSTVSADSRRKELLHLFLSTNCTMSPLPVDINVDSSDMIDRYSTMVVYETCDIETATDVISNSFYENSLPWKIRDIYVQESVLNKFTTIIKSKLKPFEACYQEDKLLTEPYVAAITLAKKMGLQLITNSDLGEDTMKPTIVVGQNRSYFDKQTGNIPLIINLNIFRTVKESIDLINKNSNLSISLWNENISTVYEFISKVNTNCIWINSNGVFNTRVPFPFNELGFKNIGALNTTSVIREQEGNIEFQCYENGSGNFSADAKIWKITKTIFINSVKVELRFDTSILNNPEDYQNFIGFCNYKTIVIPFGVTFSN